MEIKTTEEISIEDYTKVANKKWVAVDDVLNEIEEIFSEGFFNYIHITYGVDDETINEKMIDDINDKVIKLKDTLSEKKNNKSLGLKKNEL